MENPIEGINPDSFEELFSRNALKLADQDIDQIVAKLRKDRAMWAANEAVEKVKTSKTATQAKAKMPKITIEDLLS